MYGFSSRAYVSFSGTFGNAFIYWHFRKRGFALCTEKGSRFVRKRKISRKPFIYRGFKRFNPLFLTLFGFALCTETQNFPKRLYLLVFRAIFTPDFNVFFGSRFVRKR